MAEKDGTIWIGTLKGVSRYHPADQNQPPAAPRAIITAVRFGEKTADPAAVSTIPFRDHSFSTGFGSLTFRGEKDVLFRYRLTGLDEGWTETRQHEARYPSLPAGLYQFDVMVRRAEGTWSGK